MSPVNLPETEDDLRRRVLVPARLLRHFPLASRPNLHGRLDFEPARLRLAGALPVRIALQCFFARANALAAAFGVVMAFAPRMAAIRHFLYAVFTPPLVLQTYRFPRMTLVTPREDRLRLLPTLRTIVLPPLAKFIGVLCVRSYGISCCPCGVRTCTCASLRPCVGVIRLCGGLPCGGLPWSWNLCKLSVPS